MMQYPAPNMKMLYLEMLPYGTARLKKIYYSDIIIMSALSNESLRGTK